MEEGKWFHICLPRCWREDSGEVVLNSPQSSTTFQLPSHHHITIISIDTHTHICVFFFFFFSKSLRFVANKVAMDGIIFGPLDLFVFFTYMGFSLGKNVQQVKEDVKRDFLLALFLESGVWPIIQVVNFRYVPVRHQLLYVNIFYLMDNTFLSWVEQQKDVAWK
ncbi:hypothetical protein UlMin_002539 [Ulmus minor]